MPRKAKEIVPHEDRCINRVTSETTVQLFGDRIHKFYLEQRCTDRKEPGEDICSRCNQPATSKKQYARTFPRGRVNEPLPPDVHIFGSEWYYKSLDKWGDPPTDIVFLAIHYQEEARKGFVSKVVEPSSSSSISNMPPRRKSKVLPSDPSVPVPVPVPVPVSDPVPESVSVVLESPKGDVPKKVRKPRVAKKDPSVSPPSVPVVTVVPESSPVNPEPIPASVKLKRVRKPRVVAPLPPMETVYDEKESFEPSESSELTEPSEPIPKPKRAVKRTVKKKQEPVVHPQSAMHQESCIPSHVEEALEEHSISDYETEIVSLSLFQVNDTTYFRDAKKNKLYRRIKEKTIGPYVGRYDPSMDTIVTDIPDSDDEEDE